MQCATTLTSTKASHFETISFYITTTSSATLDFPCAFGAMLASPVAQMFMTLTFYVGIFSPCVTRVPKWKRRFRACPRPLRFVQFPLRHVDFQCSHAPPGVDVVDSVYLFITCFFSSSRIASVEQWYGARLMRWSKFESCRLSEESAYAQKRKQPMPLELLLKPSASRAVRTCLHRSTSIQKPAFSRFPRKTEKTKRISFYGSV